MIKSDNWEPAAGLTLEPNALTAAKECVRSLALTAGPGAGKTELLAQRADFLLRTGTCRYPKRILAISFKVDASSNLKERVKQRCGSHLASRFDSHTFHAFAKRIIDRFRLALSGSDALKVGYKIGDKRIIYEQITLEDLVPLAIKIIQQSKFARNSICQTYSDVFLDEFQDCTNHQYELLKLVFQGTNIRLTAVGDTKQKIMGWAGAVDGIFETFVEDFGATPLNIYRNFRSQPQLLRLQNEVIRKLDPSSAIPDEQIIGGEGEVLSWIFKDSKIEAVCLADRIAHWIEVDNVPASEIAVLVSKQPELYTNHLVAELELRGVPYRNENNLQDIATEPIAHLIVDYLSCIYSTRKPNAWKRLKNQLLPFMDDELQDSESRKIDRLIEIERKKASLMAVIDQTYSGWWDSVKRFLNYLPRETLSALSHDYESLDRLKELVSITKQRIDELLGLEPELPRALRLFSDENAVRILTIHKSKGLEFDTVIILGVEKEAFWGAIREERSAFFVGVSRAKRRLVVTVCNHRETPPLYRKKWCESRSKHEEFIGYVSPFLVDATRELCQEDY